MIGKLFFVVGCLLLVTIHCFAQEAGVNYFPPPESEGGWRKLEGPEEIRRLAGMDPTKLDSFKQWLLDSDDRPFAAAVIRNGYIVLEVERERSGKTHTGDLKSCAKAICATVLSIASEESQKGNTPRKMTFDDPAFDYIPWAHPLSDPRKKDVKVKQLLNHTSGITPEGYGVRNSVNWGYALGHGGDGKTAKLFFDPGTDLQYSTFPVILMETARAVDLGMSGACASLLMKWVNGASWRPFGKGRKWL